MLSITLVMALTLFAFAGYAADKAPKAKAPEKAAAKAPADQEQIAKVLDQWKAAALAGDLDKAMAVFSDKFKNVEQGDKAGVKTYLKDAFDAGYLKNMELDTSKANAPEVEAFVDPASGLGYTIRSWYDPSYGYKMVPYIITGAAVANANGAVIPTLT